MNLPQLLKKVFILLCVLCLSGLSMAQRPNIVLVISDDHAYQAIGCYGGTLMETPNIDRIATNGVRFANCFVGNSLCAPSRATLLTGKHSHAHGVMQNSNTFNSSQQTMAKLMQASGYKTAWIGKWHLKTTPTGFDYYEILNDQGEYYKPVLNKNGVNTTYTGQYVSDVITERAIAWLDDNASGTDPFMIIVGHKATHRNWMPGPELYADPAAFNAYEAPPLMEPPTLFDDYATRNSGAATATMRIADHLTEGSDLHLTNTGNGEYDRMTTLQKIAFDAAYDDIRQYWTNNKSTMTTQEKTRFKYKRYMKDYLRSAKGVDDSVGQILDYLESHNLADNTIFIYTSDQGFYLGEHGWFDKRWMYEESLRTPFVMQWPGHFQAGQVVDQLVQNIDFAPTLLEAGELPTPSDMHGHSFLGFAEGTPPASWNDSVYYHFVASTESHAVPKHYGVRTDRYKLIYYYELNQWELFDLQTDPTEINNLYGQPGYNSITLSMMYRIKQAREQYGDTVGSDFTIPSDLADGDFNGDGQVNALDWHILKSNYRIPLTGLDISETYQKGDMNADGQVDDQDYSVFKDNYPQ